jgi:DNA-binding SARP family transcriptional activator
MIIDGEGRLEYRILGPLEVWRDGIAVPVPAPRQRAVLATLLLHANRVVPADQLVALLWGDRPPATARNTLQTLVYRLRRQLDPQRRTGPLETRLPGYLLRVDSDRLDLGRFEDLFRRGRAALAGGDSDQAGRLLAAAVGLWRGPALADVGADELHRTEGIRLAEWQLQAVEEWVEADLRRGRHAELVGELRRLVTEHPLRERLSGQLIRALDRTGRRAEALATYRVLREVLVEQVGVEPGVDLQRLHRAVLRGDVDGAASPPDAPDLPAPVRATVPRQLPTDVAGFTGRTAQLARLNGLLASADREPGAVPVLAVVGMAGVGKTALAVHWAHRVRGRFPDGQLFLDLHGCASAIPLRPIDALAQFLRALGVPAAAVPVDPQEAAGLYRSRLADRRMLVVLDNVRAAGQVQPLLPGSPGCLVLVTSRDRLDGLVAHRSARLLRLDPLPPGEAQALLARQLAAHRVTGSAADLADLARRCGNLPLALRLATANLVTRRLTLPEYAARLAAGGPLAGLAVADGDDDQSAVRTAFGLSYATLPEPAARLFRLLGVAPGADLPVAGVAALAGLPPEPAARLLDLLAAAHLVREVAPGRFSLHDLLRDFAAELAAGGPDPEPAAARTRLLEWYAATAAWPLDPDRLRPPLPDRLEPAGWDGSAGAAAWLEPERVSLVRAAEPAAAAGAPAVA